MRQFTNFIIEAHVNEALALVSVNHNGVDFISFATQLGIGSCSTCSDRHRHRTFRRRTCGTGE